MQPLRRHRYPEPEHPVLFTTVPSPFSVFIFEKGLTSDGQGLFIFFYATPAAWPSVPLPRLLKMPIMPKPT